MIEQTISRLVLLAVVISFGAFGCASNGDTQTAEPIPTGEQTTQRTEQEAERMSSGEILHVLQTINEAEISQAQLAIERSDNPEVQQAAEMIIQDHRALQERVDQVADETGATMTESQLSREVSDQSTQVIDELSALSGEEFDQAFLEKQVSMHEMALRTARDELMPEAMDAQVVQLLSNASRSLEQHLVMARQSYQQSQDEAIGGGPEEEQDMDQMDEDQMDEMDRQDHMDEMDEDHMDGMDDHME